MTNPSRSAIVVLLATLLWLPGTSIYSQNKIFWGESTAEVTKISKANLDGTNVEDILVSHFKSPDGIALDVASGKMYWTENSGAIRRSDLDGSNPELLTTLPGALGDISLDLVNGKMYFTTDGATQISRANLDGSNVELIWSSVSDWYSGFAVDVAGGKIYSCEQIDGSIFRMDTDGSNLEVLIPNGVYYPYDIDLDIASGKMYWVDGGFGAIYRSNLDGTNIELLFNPTDGGASYIHLDLDNGKIYWTDTYGKLFRSDLNGDNVEEVLPSGLVFNSRLAFDPLADKIYWSNNYDHVIKRTDINGTNVETIHETDIAYPTALSVDLVNNKIYWSDEYALKRANFDGTAMETIASNPYESIYATALDVDNSKIYWAAGNRFIKRSNLDGSNQEDLIEFTTGNIVQSIFLDISGGKMYWGNLGTSNQKLSRANLDGSGIETLITGYRVANVAIANSKLYWTSVGPNRGIRRADLDGSNIEHLITTQLTTPFRLVVDPENGKIVWGDSSAGLLERANLDGSSRETLLTNFTTRGFAIHENIDQNFTVQPPCTTLPVPVCNDYLTIVLNSNFTAEITPEDLDEGSYDPCGGQVTLAASQTTFDCDDMQLGSVEVELIVTNADLVSSTCFVNVNVNPPNNPINSDYRIRFPADGIVDCVDAFNDTDDVLTEGCGLFAINVQDNYLTPSGGDCLKLERTYTIINWLEYNGGAPVVIRRDEDCNGTPGDQDIWVVRRPGGAVYLDSDGDETNGIPAPNAKGTSCDGLTNPTGYWISKAMASGATPPRDLTSTGYWQYTRIIRVQSSSGPTINPQLPTGAFCVSDFFNCEGSVTVAFYLENLCPPNDYQLIIHLDENNDGTPDQLLDNNQYLNGSLPFFTISGLFPDGQHAFIVEAHNGCGGVSTLSIPFEVGGNCGPTTIECPAAQTFELASGACEMGAPDLTSQIVTLCGTYTQISQLPAPGTLLGLGSHNIGISVTNAGGYTSSCLTSITVDGLPCGFNDPGTQGVGSSTGSVSFNPNNGVFAVNSSNGGSSTTSDNVFFIPQQLCGDGEIIAEVTSVANGYAGVMMRENLAPGAKKFAIYTNFGVNLKSERRLTTNGVALINSHFRPNSRWLRITRVGNNIKGFTSMDGVIWNLLINLNITMTSCIQVGLATYSQNTATPVTATFDNVQVIDYAPLVDPGSGDQFLISPDVDIYPNPSSGEVFLQWGTTLSGQSADLDIYDAAGRLVYSRRWDIVDITKERLDLSALDNGIYMVRIAQSDAVPKLLRLVLAK